MKILHLYSDWKWTGPSEPILNLCCGLKKEGLEIHLACLSAPAKSQRSSLARSLRCSDNFGAKQTTYQPIQMTLPDKATEAGIPLLTPSTPSKYLSLFYIKPHINALSKYISSPSPSLSPGGRGAGEGARFDIIHCHSALDHFYASRLTKKFNNIKIIRTNHKGYPLELSITNKSLMKNAIDGYITLSAKLAETDQKNFGLAPERINAIPSGIDVKRFSNNPPHPLNPPSNPPFSPFAKGGRGDLMGLGGFNINPNDIVVGIVARVQRHRRFNIILEAIKQVVKEMPQVKLVIVGRGTHYNELVTEPVKRLGLENNVIQAGYRTGDYLDILNIFDFGLFLVPGSDGSCRAGLEMMASGKPLIAAKRGILPEIVDNDQNGLVIDDTAGNLAQAILKLARDKALRERFSQSARQKIEQQFSLERTIKLTKEFYLNIIK